MTTINIFSATTAHIVSLATSITDNDIAHLDGADNNALRITRSILSITATYLTNALDPKLTFSDEMRDNIASVNDTIAPTDALAAYLYDDEDAPTIAGTIPLLTAALDAFTQYIYIDALDYYTLDVTNITNLTDLANLLSTVAGQN